MVGDLTARMQNTLVTGLAAGSLDALNSPPSWDFMAPEFSSWMYPISAGILLCYRRGFTKVGGTAQTVFQTIDWTLSFLVD